MKHQQVYDGLANMLSAGISLKAALRTSVAKGSGALHNAVIAVANAIESGSTLAAAIAKDPKGFPRFDTAMIEMAEMAGRLSEAFHALAKWYGLKTRIWHILKSGLAYPAIVLHAGAFILPLPLLFQGQALVEYLLAVFSMLFYLYLFIGVIFVIFKLTRGNNPLRRVLDSALLMVTLLGKALHNLAFGRYCFGFLMLYQCGIPMEKTARFAADLTGNTVVSAILAGGVQSVRQGLPVSKGFSSAVPLDFKTLWITGETTGRLEETLEKLYEDRIEVGQHYLRQFARWLPRVIYAVFFFVLLDSMISRFSNLIQIH
jgi:type IV pilus assembly protein PilC